MTDRFEYARRKGIKDQAIALPMEERENDRLAKEAEIVVAEYLGVEHRERRVDGGVDVTYRGWTIDVKWSPQVPFSPDKPWRVSYACLKVASQGPPGKLLRAMIYVAVHGSIPPDPDGGFKPTDLDVMKIYGFAFRSEVRRSPTRDFGRKLRSGEPSTPYAVDLTDLHSKEVLKALPPFDPERPLRETMAIAFEAVDPGFRY